MSTDFSHKVRGFVIGILSAVLVAVIIGSFSGVRRVILQDNQITYNTGRIDKLETDTSEFKTQLNVVIVQHEMLMEEVKQNHTEEMEAFRAEKVENTAIRAEAIENARIAKEAMAALNHRGG